MCGLLVLTVLKAERESGAGTATWRRAPHPRRRCELPKPPRKPTWLHAHFCLSSKDSHRSPRVSRASLPVRPGLVRVAVARAVEERSCGAAASSPLSSGRAGRISWGRNFPGSGIRLGPRRRQRRGLRAGWLPDQRSRPAEPGRVPECRGAPWGGQGCWGGGDIGATDLARRPLLTGGAHPSARSRRSSRGPRATGRSLRRSPRSRPRRRRGGARTRSRAPRLLQSSLEGTRCGHRPAERGSRAP